MSANNQIGSGAIVISSTADPAVKELDRAKAAVDSWGVRAQASMKTSTAGLSSLMSSAWERSNDTLANKMRAAWDQSQAQAAAAATTMKANLDQMRADAEKAKAAQKGLGKDAMKGAGFGEMAEMGLVGTFVALGRAMANAFETTKLDQFNRELAKSGGLAQKLLAAYEKRGEKRMAELENMTGADLKAGLEEHIAKLERDKADLARGLQTQEKALDDARKSDGVPLGLTLTTGAGVASKVMGGDSMRTFMKQMPGGSHLQMEEDALKAGIDEYRAKYESAAKQIEAAKDRLEKALQTPQGMFNLPLLGSIGQAAIEASKKIRADTDETIKNLKSAGDLIGMSPGDAAVYEAKKRGEQDVDNLARIRMQAEANAQRQVTAGVEEQIKALRLEAETYGMTADAAELYRLEQAGATKESLQRLAIEQERIRNLKDAIEGLRAPKVAGAVLAGGAEDYAIKVRMKGFDIGDGNALQRETNEKIDKLIETTKGQARDIAEMRQGMIKLEGL